MTRSVLDSTASAWLRRPAMVAVEVVVVMVALPVVLVVAPVLVGALLVTALRLRRQRRRPGIREVVVISGRQLLDLMPTRTRSPTSS